MYFRNNQINIWTITIAGGLSSNFFNVASVISNEGIVVAGVSVISVLSSSVTPSKIYTDIK